MSTRSNRAMRLLTIDFVVPSALAASVKLSTSATRTKAKISFKSSIATLLHRVNSLSISELNMEILKLSRYHLAQENRSKMIHLYTWRTPNGFKPLIMLEEIGFPYELRPIDIRAGEQSRREYLAINPNGKIPAMVDDSWAGGSLTLFESGAILVYLADKSGMLLANHPSRRFQVVQWLMFQMSAVGPMFGQLGYFSRADTKAPFAIERFKTECARLIGVLESHLAVQPWFGDSYSIADISMFTWIRASDFLGLDLSTAPHLRDWRDEIAERPAVKRALATFETPSQE